MGAPKGWVNHACHPESTGIKLASDLREQWTTDGKRDAGKRPTHQLAPILPGQNTWMSARSSIEYTNPQVFAPKFLHENTRTDRPRTRCFNPRTGAGVAMGQPFAGVASRSIYLSSILLLWPDRLDPYKVMSAGSSKMPLWGEKMISDIVRFLYFCILAQKIFML